MRNSIFNCILDDIQCAVPGEIFRTVRQKSIQAGRYCRSWDAPEAAVRAKLLDTAQSMVSSRYGDKIRKLAERSFEFGLKDCK